MNNKVTCVRLIFASDRNGLTLGKEYTVVREGKYSYVIVDDNDKTFPYDKKNFRE